MKYLFLVLLIVVGSSTATNSKKNITNNGEDKIKGNILCMMVAASPSHHVWNGRLMRALAEDGYNVTAVSIDIDKKPTPNLHYIHLEGAYEDLYSGENNFNLLEVSSLPPAENAKLFYTWSILSCKSVLQSNGFRTFLNYPNDMKFDLVIYDATTGPCFLPFLDKFPKAPLITVSGFFIAPFVSDISGTPLFPSLVPHYTLKYLPKMNFLQRIHSLFLYVVDKYSRREMVDKQDELMRKYFGPKMKYLGSYDDRSEILLVNSHPSMQQAQALLPNVIEVGGLQIKDPLPLPDDIDRFLSSGAKGAVLFSLGTNMKSELLGEAKIRMFVNVIRRLPQYNFLWKFESDTLPPLPKNLMVKKWISQNDILAHPNIKLFISHTGLLSTQEATWHGVPILAIPFFGDQPLNAFTLVKDGVGEQLNFFTTNEEEVYSALTKMLGDPGYFLKMKQRSRQFRDRPQHPLDLALYWCKYLIRNGNAQHLRSPAIEMSQFVLHMWDVLLVLVGVVMGTLFLVIKLLCFLIRRRNITKVKTN